MSFQPIVPMGGYAGWAFLNRTLDRQLSAHSASVSNETSYFSENISGVQSVNDLLSDRRLLTVSLGAFGLEGDIDNRYFIGRVLDEGVTNSSSLGNRLSDKSYFQMAQVFDFGEGAASKTGDVGFATDIISSFERRRFEKELGEVNEDFRFAMALQRDLPPLANSGLSTDGKWYTILGKPSLRHVFQVTFGLPSSVGGLDIDRQMEIFKERSRNLLGTDSLEGIASQVGMNKVIQKFLLRSEIGGVGNTITPAGAALTLIQSAKF